MNGLINPLGTTLEALKVVFQQHLVLKPHEYDALALWTVHTHLMAIFEHSPRLFLWSATFGSGKSTALDMLEKLAYNPLLTSNPTRSSYIRTVSAAPTTLLLDEADKWWHADKRLAADINAGHKRNGVVTLSEQNKDGKWETTLVPVWAAVAIASKGTALQADVTSRALKIVMRRAPLRGQFTPYSEYDHGATLDTLRGYVATITAAVLPVVLDAQGGLRRPGWITDGRMWDNWRPLYAIAATAGDDWPGRVDAAAQIMTNVTLKDKDLGERLLWDIRSLFDEHEWTRVHSQTIVDELHEDEELPWAKFNKGRGMDVGDLASMLDKFEIRPERNAIKIGPRQRRGYLREAFEPAWQTYGVGAAAAVNPFAGAVTAESRGNAGG